VSRAKGDVEVRERLFPLSLELSFGNRRVWIGAVEVGPDGDPYSAADHVTVAFDEDVARRLELAV
jgi:hypothetical protein